jgi:protein-S-isoprenylcysteine O-methyltransferase Ste14
MHLPTLGSRGQGWVWGQFVLAALVVLAAQVGPGWPSTPFGWVLVVGAGALGLWSLRSLGDALTPYPRPRSSGELVDHGPYRFVRHPIYSSMLVALFGVVLIGSWWGFIPLVALVVWWLGKARVEEDFLRARYPDYAAYCQRVRARLIPGLL